MKMMLFVLIFVLLAVPVFAQDFPKVEVFGGYSMIRADIDVGGADFQEGSSLYIPECDVYATISNIEASQLLIKGGEANIFL